MKTPNILVFFFDKKIYLFCRHSILRTKLYRIRILDLVVSMKIAFTLARSEKNENSQKGSNLDHKSLSKVLLRSQLLTGST